MRGFACVATIVMLAVAGCSGAEDPPSAEPTSGSGASTSSESSTSAPFETVTTETDGATENETDSAVGTLDQGRGWLEDGPVVGLIFAMGQNPLADSSPDDSEFSSRALELQREFLDAKAGEVAQNGDGSPLCAGDGFGDGDAWITACSVRDGGTVAFFALTKADVKKETTGASEMGANLCVGDDYFVATESERAADLVANVFDCEQP